ncbi:MAG: hypothetical protein IJU66_04835 [Oscillospiraceae bacterium]|nr:hypothetical protein [Oscillospiraceae bacterium]
MGESKVEHGIVGDPFGVSDEFEKYRIGSISNSGNNYTTHLYAYSTVKFDLNGVAGTNKPDDQHPLIDKNAAAPSTARARRR